MALASLARSAGEKAVGGGGEVTVLGVAGAALELTGGAGDCGAVMEPVGDGAGVV